MTEVKSTRAVNKMVSDVKISVDLLLRGHEAMRDMVAMQVARGSKWTLVDQR